MSQVSTTDNQQQLLDYKRSSPKSSNRERKSYAAFLVDMPFNANVMREKDDDQESIYHLMNCLRYRLVLAPKKIKQSISSDATSSRQDSNIPAWKASLRQPPNSVQDSSSAVQRGKSLYDTLLQLIDEFDAAGAAEIFRLLLERRSAIPLFVPESKKHHLQLLKHITLPDGIRLGEDKSMVRIAVLSCRKRNKSQTYEILKNIFNIESVHRYDFQTNCITSESLSAEIGCGCVQMEGSEKFQPLLVTHVVGDFRPLWPFLRQFSDYLLIEDAPDDKDGVCNLLMTEENKRILQDISTVNSKLESSNIPYVCIWKPSDGEVQSDMKDGDECGFRHFRTEGQLDKNYHILRSIVGEMVHERASRPSSSERLCLHNMSILEDADYTTLRFETSVDVNLALSVIPKLGDVKKNEFVLQKNFREQAKHEESKCKYKLDEKKVHEENSMINRCREIRRKQAPEVQKHPLLQLLLNLLDGKSSCSRVLSIRLLDKELVQRSEKELGPELIQIRELYLKFVNQSTKARKGNDDEKRKLDDVRKILNEARTEFNEKVLSIEHLWRELSHLFTDVPSGKRTSAVSKVPHLAAQHLMDGFCIELLDGDSNMYVLSKYYKLICNLKLNLYFFKDPLGLG